MDNKLTKFCYNSEDRDLSLKYAKEFTKEIEIDAKGDEGFHLNAAELLFSHSMQAAIYKFQKSQNTDCRIPDPTTLTIIEKMLPALEVILIYGVDSSLINAAAGEDAVTASERMCNKLLSEKWLTPSSLNICIDESANLINLERGSYLSFTNKYKYEADLLICGALNNNEISYVEGGTMFYPFKLQPLANLLELVVEHRLKDNPLNDIQVCEVGFNLGHSSLLWLLNPNPNVKVLAFDLGEHSYSKTAAKYLKGRFGEDRIEVIFGDSTKTIPNYTGTTKCDLIFVDGGHTFEIAHSDITSFSRLARSNEHTVLIVDDINQDEVEEGWEKATHEGKVVGFGEVYEDAFFLNARDSRSSIIYGRYL